VDPTEYHNLDRIEREHWYYSGKRQLVLDWIERTRPLRPDDTLLDFGAGTGIFASGLKGRCRVLVLDAYEESRKLLARHFPPDAILAPEADDHRIPLPAGCVDCVTTLDVLEHIRADQQAVDDIHRVLRPGGILVATVPADMRLWSDWDEALHHVRRYSRRSLASLFRSRHWAINHIAHTNVLAYPAVFLIRGLRASKRREGTGRSRTEDRIPPAPLNRLLRAAFVSTGNAGWFRMPFGVSLLVVATKK